jgi:proline dehydrogenase
MLRSTLLYLARSKRAKATLMALPGARRASRRFVAGETLNDTIGAVRALNEKGLLVSLDHLGENVYSAADADRAVQAYLETLERIAQTGVKANVSLKLTQLGLDVGEAVCMANVRRVLNCAQTHQNFVRIDMEGSAYTEKTLHVFRALRQEFSNVGIVIQAYLRRSEADVRELAAEGANIRLCKGAYQEPPNVAFPQKSDVDANFVKLVEIFLDDAARAKGAYIGVATHDERMIEATKAYATQHAIGKDQFEFQMLYGVRPQAQTQLAADGYKVRVYVGYGTEWYPFFMRRLAERPANLGFILKNLFRA